MFAACQLQMPFEKAKGPLREMRSLPNPPKVAIVTMLEDPRYVRELEDLGARRIPSPRSG